jgi:hypothetical protein
MHDQDQLFKLLLQQFFRPFLAAFVPELARDLAAFRIEFLDKELTRLEARRRRTKVVDLVARVKLRGGESFVLVHVEHQGRRERNIGLRLLLYAVWLMDRYGLPVYPVLLISYRRPRDREPQDYLMAVRGRRVLEFHYRVVQLNRLDWREFAGLRNPAATALMSYMNIAPADRVRVTLQILRLLASLRLDPERMDLIAGFVERGLALTAKEYLAVERRLRNLPAKAEQRAVMKFTTFWERRGLQQGRREGRREGELHVVKRLLKRRLGGLDPRVEKQLDHLSGTKLTALTEALFDFTDSADLHRWLARNTN